MLGIISAASLPLGAIASLAWTPRSLVAAALMAFGGGALLAALTLDLVAEALQRGAFRALAVGCLIGCALFVSLNQLVNRWGGFLRKAATTVQYLTRLRSQHVRSLAERLSHVPLFRTLPPEFIGELLPQVQERTYQPGTTIIRQGEPGDSFYLIEHGEVDVIDESAGGTKLRTMHDGEVFGEMALLSGARSSSIGSSQPHRTRPGPSAGSRVSGARRSIGTTRPTPVSPPLGARGHHGSRCRDPCSDDHGCAAGGRGAPGRSSTGSRSRW